MPAKTRKQEEPVSQEIDTIDVHIPEGVQVPILPGESFGDLAQQLTGATNTRELMKIKQDLCGVPMILTSFTFRAGVKKDGRAIGDYVSVEAVTYDNRRVVFNDSSTGIRRQVADYLSRLGVIGEGQDLDAPFQTWDDEVMGRYGQWRFTDDVKKITWRIEAEPARVDPETGEVTEARPIRFLARHGLRRSDYHNEEVGKDSTTFYLD